MKLGFHYVLSHERTFAFVTVARMARLDGYIIYMEDGSLQYPNVHPVMFYEVRLDEGDGRDQRPTNAHFITDFRLWHPAFLGPTGWTINMQVGLQDPEAQILGRLTTADLRILKTAAEFAYRNLFSDVQS